MHTFKVITDPESMSLLLPAGLLWHRNEYDPTYRLLPADDFDFKAWWDRQASEGMTLSEDEKFCWPGGWWRQCAIRVECDSTTTESVSD